MNVNDKIKQVLKDKNLTPSYFADEIGVQRSSISHILSGRNRPSFDIIQKIIRRFPELGYDWILEEDQPVTNVNPRPVEIPAISRKPSPQPEIVDEKPPYIAPSQSPVAKNKDEKIIERILVFYTDGTFREYAPS
ncbi:helix-turn-helix transcriptional regulator [Larkinella humicola]|uniref:Helix-turn-helix transcriptional regulator n=1 Tax=Larkinella humicola TaxID=2607654 RepID=A0A5N1JPN8_9BACT|nr:helix-turn-helix transcriptional regulator [Larkinella humicola]KAA9356579.1 helix-turn-helix transcriptional regulator [Larkinella humicola]